MKIIFLLIFTLAVFPSLAKEDDKPKTNDLLAAVEKLFVTRDGREFLISGFNKMIEKNPEMFGEKLADKINKKYQKLLPLKINRYSTLDRLVVAHKKVASEITYSFPKSEANLDSIKEKGINYMCSNPAAIVFMLLKYDIIQLHTSSDGFVMARHNININDCPYG